MRAARSTRSTYRPVFLDGEVSEATRELLRSDDFSNVNRRAALAFQLACLHTQTERTMLKRLDSRDPT